MLPNLAVSMTLMASLRFGSSHLETSALGTTDASKKASPCLIDVCLNRTEEVQPSIGIVWRGGQLLAQSGPSASVARQRRVNRVTFTVARHVQFGVIRGNQARGEALPV